MSKTATITLYLPLGDPRSVRTAEISNWSGKAIAAPRSDLEQFMVREESRKTGIYSLLGVNPKSGKPAAYIGEAEQVGDRIKQHKTKDFWNSAVAFVSKDDSLTKAHAKYLEGRVIQLAQESGRFEVLNAQSSGARLPESAQGDMEVYLENVIQLMPVLGSDLLVPIAQPFQARANVLSCTRKGAIATGMRSPNGFVVFKDSTAVKNLRAYLLEDSKNQGKWIVTLRQKLLDEGSLVEDGDFVRFVRDVEFSSPSAAAAMIDGGSAAGPIRWKDASGRTLKEIEGS